MSRTRWVAAALLLVGLAVRLSGLTDPLLGFHPTRQYRSAVVARGLALEALPGLTEAEREAARISARRQGLIEPPIFEHAAAAMYRVAGQEALWMPRLAGVLAWLAGAAAVYGLAAAAWGWLAGLAALAVVVLLPFGVTASQAFQPDGPFTALVAGAVAAAWWRHRASSAVSVGSFLAISAAAILVKPVAVFWILPVAAVLSVARRGVVRGAWRWMVWAAIVCAPAAAWALYIARVNPGTLGDRFFPQLWVQPAYWMDWARMLHRTVTWPVLALALVGLWRTRGVHRWWLGALWVGYVDVPPEPVEAEGAVVFHGWALDDLSMRRVWLGCRTAAGGIVPLGDAARGGVRPDVAAVHPGAHDLTRVGWAFTLDTTRLRGLPQPVTVEVFAEDGDGLRTVLGARTLTIRGATVVR